MATGLPKRKDMIRPWHDVHVREEMFDEIVGRLANGENLIGVCGTPGKQYPSPASFLTWVENNPEYAERYARAMKIRADVHAEKIVHVAETENNTQKARNVIDAIKWHNEKSAPKKYGARVLNESNVTIKQRLDLSTMPYEVRQQMRAVLMAKLGGQTIDHEPLEDDNG